MAAIFTGFVIILVMLGFSLIDSRDRKREADAIKTQIADLQRSMEEKLAEIKLAQEKPTLYRLEQKAKDETQKIYRAVPRVVDYEASQQAALKEFEPEGHPV